jgi:adenylylsulfate kinase
MMVVTHVLSARATMLDSSRNGTKKGLIVWFTGLSGAGKSTLAEAVFSRLQSHGRAVEILDGDVVRAHLCKGLGFSREDRCENIRRIAFVGNLLAQHGVVVLVPVIAPYRSIRAEVRNSSHSYIEVFVNAPLEICEQRDPKGLYRRARAGEIANFTGIDDPYEIPENPDLECQTHLEGVDACVSRIIQRIATATAVDLTAGDEATAAFV